MHTHTHAHSFCESNENRVIKNHRRTQSIPPADIQAKIRGQSPILIAQVPRMRTLFTWSFDLVDGIGVWNAAKWSFCELYFIAGNLIQFVRMLFFPSWCDFLCCCCLCCSSLDLSWHDCVSKIITNSMANETHGNN